MSAAEFGVGGFWEGKPKGDFTPGNLAAKFVQPPFTVLDTRKGDWQDRKRAWISLGIESELGRGDALLGAGLKQLADIRPGLETLHGTSIFDPVLCELAYRWFVPPGGSIIDPFAGGSVRGIVASKLGHQYTGIDLADEQLIANREQAGRILLPGDPMPIWHHGDSAQMDDLLPAGEEYDFIWTCPPYGDLEVYSEDPRDLSTMPWGEFMRVYDLIIEAAVRRLRPGRFAGIVVTEIRHKDGGYRGFVPYTIHAFQRHGMRWWNDAVLVNAAGSLPIRATRTMEASRKLGRSHQNVLIFLKGEPPRNWDYERQAPPSPQMEMGW